MAISAANMTNLNADLYEAYMASGLLEEAWARKHPFLDLFEKEEVDVSGKLLVMPLLHARPQANSKGDNFSTGWNAAQLTYSKMKRFEITPKEHYGFAEVDGLLLRATAKRDAAFMNARVLETHAAMTNLTDAVAKAMFSSGLGAIGTVASVSGATITLANRYDVIYFEQDLFVVAAANDASAIRTVGSTGLKVSGRNVNTGVVTFGSVTVSTEASGISVGDTLYAAWARPTGASAAAEILNGLKSWIPSADPAGSENFNGVDRSTDSYLFGSRIGGLGRDYADQITDAIHHSLVYGGSEDEDRVLICNPITRGRILKEMGSQVSRTKMEGQSLVFDTVKVAEGVALIADVNCPIETSFYLQPSMWSIATRGGIVSVGNELGEVIMQRQGSKGYVIQCSSVCDLACRLPAAQVRIDHTVQPSGT